MKSRLPAGYSNGPSNMQGMMKQAQKMQENMTKLQAELDEREYNITSGGSAVELVINGKKEVKSLKISPEVIDPEDVEMLEDLILAAVNEGIRTVEDTNSREMEKITGSISIPGMSGLF